MQDQIVDTWNIHNRINLYLLDAIPPDSMTASLPPKSRSVHDLFAHIHNVRLMWLKAVAPELMEGLEKIEPKSNCPREQLAAQLEASGAAIAVVLSKALQGDGRIKGFKPHAVAFLGYLISHESHHRGQIEWALKASGKHLDDKASYGLWEWGVR